MLSSVRRPQPQVTGISPKEGPPGTRVTIRGENLGIDARDLIGLRICGVDCLLSAEWKSPNKIVARTGQAKGKGDIIVVTRAGGVGNSTVTFRGYNIQIGPLQESAVWIDETQTYSSLFGRNRAGSPISADDLDDPLGISDETNDTKFPEELLQEMFPEGSDNTSLENFVPAWYLLANHHQTSFDDLKAGLGYLKRKSSQREEGPMTFVKANLPTFMDCFDTLAEMHSRLTEDQASSNKGLITQSLENVLLQSNKGADALFHDVLGRKDRADATRNALSVLQRFKFLFNLPCTIDRNIKKGDYDLVITDYTRARSLFGDTEIGVFKKVYREVENRIAAFRAMLYRKLMELPTSIEEQKRLIRYLCHLETPGDPAWQCLDNMQTWLVTLLHSCKNEHLNKDKEVEPEDPRKSPLSPRLSTTQVVRQSSFKSGTKPPQKVLFVEHLTRLLIENLPDLWRLGQAYFSGKLIKDAKKSGRIDPNKYAQFKDMVLKAVKLYCNLVRAAFLPLSLENMSTAEREGFGTWQNSQKDSPIAWLPICVRYVRSCAMSLATLDLTNDTMDLLQQLSFDMRCHCVATLLQQAIEDIQELHKRETWMVDTDDERGGTTLLPALFENLVSENIQYLHEVISPKQGEQELFHQTGIQKDVKELCIQLLQSFASTLNQLASVGNVDRDVKSRRAAIMPDLYNTGFGEKMPAVEKRTLLMLSNCSQTVDKVLPRLVELLEKNGHPDTHTIQKAVFKCYKMLDGHLLGCYIEEKSNPILGVLEQNMYAGRFDWNKCPRPTGVRNYIKEAVMGMIEVHAEVYSISPVCLHSVMSRIIEAVADELSRLIQCVTAFCHNGALQARLELQAFELTIDAYKTDETIAAIKEALDAVPEEKDYDDKMLLDDLLRKFQSQMKIQLMCFQPEQKARKTTAN